MVGVVAGALIALPGFLILWFFKIGLRYGEGNSDVGLIVANHEKLFHVALGFTFTGVALVFVGGALMWRCRVRRA